MKTPKTLPEDSRDGLGREGQGEGRSWCCISFHLLNKYIFSIYYAPWAMNSAGDQHRTKQTLFSECNCYGEKHIINKERYCVSLL